jgi:SAM-dependent methyltransferase
METLDRQDQNRQDTEAVVGDVRGKYAAIALEGGSCCGISGCGPGSEEAVTLDVGYSKTQLKAVPEGANLGLGCGAPIDHLALQPGETVVDLGSGAGIDVFLAADSVGPTGKVIGVDMTPEMLERARKNAAKAGITNAEFREGRLEHLPVESGTVDAITSNCVINLVPDKAVVFKEIARILKPGGRLVISDIILDKALPPEIEKDIYAYVGCISGAAMRGAYFEMLKEAGLSDIEIVKDIDYGAVVIEHARDEAERLAAKAGVGLDALRGTVRSVTFRARKTETATVAEAKSVAAPCCGPSCCS